MLFLLIEEFRSGEFQVNLFGTLSSEGLCLYHLNPEKAELQPQCLTQWGDMSATLLLEGLGQLSVCGQLHI